MWELENKFSIKDKLLLIHADDAGICHAQNVGIIDCLKFGLVKSYSIMVPCPWFYHIADFALRNPEFDYGIHLTLTSEWKYYKHSPLLPKAHVSSLIDNYGFYHSSVNDLSFYADTTEVFNELSAQIEQALNFGLRPTHLDCHMFALTSTQELLEVYIQLGEKFHLPILVNKSIKNFSEVNIASYGKEDLLVNSNIYMAYSSESNSPDLKSFYDLTIQNIKPGINILLIHPAIVNDEIKAITDGIVSYGALWRKQDLDYFTCEKTRQKLSNRNVKLISWKNFIWSS